MLINMEGVWKHLLIAFTLRVALVTYGEFHDRLLPVPFTDIDYRVYTDAARHVWEGGSPYDRRTYRYPPALAWLLVPNLWLVCWGKLLFSAADVLVGWLMYRLCLAQGCTHNKALTSALTWLYNPLCAVISTRGSCDALSAALVLGSLLLLLEGKPRPGSAGLLIGLAVHLRLYPLAFCPALYLSLGPRPGARQSSLFSRLVAALWPSKPRLRLTLSCILTLAALTSIGCHLYGRQCLEESVLYHLKRRDIRHNFSPYFYLQYLTQSPPSWLRVCVIAPQALLLLVLICTFGTQRHTLPFCLFAQAVVLVGYNSVVTAQYFVWFLSLLPPIVPFLALRWLDVVRIIVVWVGAQGSWLIPAYMLEFRGESTFYHIWLHGLAFFCANVYALGCIVKAYRPPDARKLKWN